MKSLILLGITSASLALTSCTTVVYSTPPPRRDVVVYGPAPAPGVTIYYDRHGRYYWGRHHRRYYVRY